MGAIYTKQTTPPVATPDKHHIAFGDGTTIEYDKAESRLTIVCAGDVSVTSSTKIEAIAPSVTFQGTVSSTFTGGGNTQIQGSTINLN
jgi:phage baseplate assembly protein V